MCIVSRTRIASREGDALALGTLVKAALVTGVFALAAYLLGFVGKGGALGGFAVGVPIYAALGWQGFAVLTLFVAGGSGLTRLGYERKRRAGTAQEAGGRRGARNAAANTLVAVVCAILAALTPSGTPFAAAFVAALGAAFADTAESEVGQLLGGRPRLITNLRPVAAGTDGAISLSGTAAGGAAAVLTALLGLALGLLPGLGAALVAAIAGFAGTIVDSLVGAVAPRVGNELTNVLCTLSAAGLVLSVS